jgi:predicted small secreted protein
LKIVLALCTALLAGCATVSDVGGRSLQTAGTISGEVLVGTAHGALQGLLIVPRVGCNDHRVCGPMVVVTTAGGALVGGLRGLGQGVTLAQRYWH